MKLLVLADIYDLHWKHGEGQADVLLSCGDVSDQVILEAARAYGCALIFAVKGNHDSTSAFTHPIVDLHLRAWEHGGVSFGGLKGSWRYKPRGDFLYDQAEVQGLLAAFSPVEIFLSHNSPRDIHEREDKVHHGFEGLNTYIQRAKPKVVIHGHQHVNEESLLDETRVIGVHGHRLIKV
jgi:Icc-related predicted phosphoesterase